MQIVATFCISYMHNATVQPAEQIDSELAIGFTIVIPAHNREVENRLSAYEIGDTGDRRNRRETGGRGRDGGCPPPPAQIRTSGTTAYGSCLGS